MVASQLGRLYGNARSLWYDFVHNVDTAGSVSREELHCNENSIHYEVTHPKLIRKLFTEVIPVESHGLLDFGSGKGRVLLVASEFPFRRVRGVELSQELNRIAENNLRSYRGRRRCSDQRVTCIDALQYAIEPQDTVFFFFYPFREPVMRPVLDNLARSLTQHPREAYLIYATPHLARLVDDIPLLHRHYSDPYCTVWKTDSTLL